MLSFNDIDRQERSIFILAKIYTEFTASKSNSEIKDDIQDL